MPELKFWNTTVDDAVSLNSYTDVQLIQFLEELVTHEVWNNGGQLQGRGLGEFYDRVVQEILNRMAESRYRD